MTEYVVLDVFTDRPFGGNPLAVIPDASGLAEDVLQKVAREFNFSETTFVLPPADPSHTARVRIFTPTSELPFAGHPVIGTAVALAARGAGPGMVLELGVGPVEVHAVGGSVRFTTRRGLTRLAEPDPELVADCLGLDPSDLATPPVIASIGLPVVLVELASVEALIAAAPNMASFRRAADRYASDVAGFGLYLYVREGQHLRARMFAPLLGIAEDPATGSAAATLAAHLAEGEDGAAQYSLTQGVEMGRPSRIEVAVSGGAITVAGQAVEMMRGTLTFRRTP
jgi:trans-2,3-dihydro-3-hydroxyanthranilate isomerase